MKPHEDLPADLDAYERQLTALEGVLHGLERAERGLHRAWLHIAAKVKEAGIAVPSGTLAEAPTKPTGRYLTVPQFAATVGVSRSTVFEMLTRGLPATKVAGLGRRILKDQADAWLAAGGARAVRSTRARRV